MKSVAQKSLRILQLQVIRKSFEKLRDVKAAIHWLQKAARTPHSWQPAKATATTDLLTRRSALLVLLRPGEFEKSVSVLKILYCLTFDSLIFAKLLFVGQGPCWPQYLGQVISSRTPSTCWLSAHAPEERADSCGASPRNKKGHSCRTRGRAPLKSDSTTENRGEFSEWNIRRERATFRNESSRD